MNPCWKLANNRVEMRRGGCFGEGGSCQTVMVVMIMMKGVDANVLFREERETEKEGLVIDILAGILFPLSALAFPPLLSPQSSGKQTERERDTKG